MGKPLCSQALWLKASDYPSAFCAPHPLPAQLPGIPRQSTRFALLIPSPVGLAPIFYIWHRLKTPTLSTDLNRELSAICSYTHLILGSPVRLTLYHFLI